MDTARAGPNDGNEGGVGGGRARLPRRRYVNGDPRTA